jgi:hypothetical protein
MPEHCDAEAEKECLELVRMLLLTSSFLKQENTPELFAIDISLPDSATDSDLDPSYEHSLCRQL